MCNRAKEGTLRLMLSVTCFLGWNLFYCVEVFCRLPLTATNTSARTEELKKRWWICQTLPTKLNVPPEITLPWNSWSFQTFGFVGKTLRLQQLRGQNYCKNSKVCFCCIRKDLWQWLSSIFFFWDPIEFSIEGTYSSTENLSRLTVS